MNAIAPLPVYLCPQSGGYKITRLNPTEWLHIQAFNWVKRKSTIFTVIDIHETSQGIQVEAEVQPSKNNKNYMYVW